MTLGTVLTLFVVPTVYTLLARKRSEPGAMNAAHAEAHGAPRADAGAGAPPAAPIADGESAVPATR
jgi:multidrug efflux pump